jgi:hypothetical protein
MQDFYKIKIIKNLGASLIVFGFLALPMLAQAQAWEGFVKCGKTTGPYTHECGFQDLLNLGRDIIRFMVIISIPIVAIGFAYAGFEYMQSGSSAEIRKKAKGHMITLMKGFFFILAAYLIVYFITSILLGPGYSILTQ